MQPFPFLRLVALCWDAAIQDNFTELALRLKLFPQLFGCGFEARNQKPVRKGCAARDWIGPGRMRVAPRGNPTARWGPACLAVPRRQNSGHWPQLRCTASALSYSHVRVTQGPGPLRSLRLVRACPARLRRCRAVHGWHRHHHPVCTLSGLRMRSWLAGWLGTCRCAGGSLPLQNVGFPAGV